MTKCESKKGWVNRNGVELFYRIRGKPREGLPVITLVHGEASSGCVFICQQRFFCKYYQTIAIDQRGFGHSSKVGPYTIETHMSDLQFVLEQLDLLKNGIYLGCWSQGTLIGQLYTLTYPQNVKKLILIDGAPQVLSSDQFPYGRTKEQEAEILDIIATNFPEYAIKGSAAAISESCPQARSVRRQIRELILKSGATATFKQTLDASLYSSLDQLSSIQCPTLIFVGLKDEVINPKASVFLHLNIANSQLIEFVDAGHAPFLTFVDKFNKDLLRFLQGYKNRCQICKHFNN